MRQTDATGIDFIENSAPRPAWPEEMGRRVQDEGGLIPRVTAVLAERGAALSEESLWEALAEAHSTEWAGARDALEKAKGKLRHLQSPENMSLGPIGRAMNGAEETAAENEEAEAQARFTLIDEELRNNPHMMAKMETLLDRKSVIEKSLQMSAAARQATRAPGDTAAPARKSALGRLFGSLSGKKAGRTRPEMRPSPAPVLSPEA